MVGCLCRLSYLLFIDFFALSLSILVYTTLTLNLFNFMLNCFIFIFNLISGMLLLGTKWVSLACSLWAFHLYFQCLRLIRIYFLLKFIHTVSSDETKKNIILKNKVLILSNIMKEKQVSFHFLLFYLIISKKNHSNLLRLTLLRK